MAARSKPEVPLLLPQQLLVTPHTSKALLCPDPVGPEHLAADTSL